MLATDAGSSCSILGAPPPQRGPDDDVVDESRRPAPTVVSEQAYLAILVLGALPVLSWSLYRALQSPSKTILLLTVATVLTSLFPVKIPSLRSDGHSVQSTVSDVFVFLGLLALSAEVATLLACLDCVIGNRRTRSVRRLFLNVFLVAYVTYLAGWVFRRVSGAENVLASDGQFSTYWFTLGFALALGIYFLLGSGVMSLAASIVLKKSWRGLWLKDFLGAYAANAIGAFTGGCIFIGLSKGGVYPALTAIPVVVVIYYSYRINYRLISSLHESQVFLESTMNSLSSAVAILDDSGLIEAANATWRNGRELELFGEDFPIGSNYLSKCDAAGEDMAVPARMVTQGIREVIFRRSDTVRREYACESGGEVRWYSVNVTRFDRAGKLQIVVAHEDITDIRVAERSVVRLAYHDDLTRLPNRTFAVDYLSGLGQFGKGGLRFCLLAFDLDGFGRINGSFGREIGDEVLGRCARAVQGQIQSIHQPFGRTPAEYRRVAGFQDLVARADGDEFVVLLTNVASESEAAGRIQAIRQALQGPMQIEGKEIFVSASVGAALAPQDGRDPEILMQHACTALRYAKKRGDNGTCFYSKRLGLESAQYVSMSAKVRSALKEKRLFLVYQPRVLTLTGEQVGAEALVRMSDPGGGVVAPADFIPVAEDSGLIVPITDWILERAALQANQWRMSRRAARVSVNISARHIEAGTLVESVSRVLSDTRLDPRLLELELTESMLLQDLDLCIQTMRDLKKLGVSIALDDFGTGYSSLSWLSRLPIDTVKIDRSFLAHLPVNGGVVRAIVAVGKELGVGVVAEGVETAEQLNFLREIGCEESQGYLFSQPAPAADLGWVGGCLESGIARDCGPPSRIDTISRGGGATTQSSIGEPTPALRLPRYSS